MYGAEVDTLKAIAQKLGIEMLVFTYGPTREALSLSVRFFNAHEAVLFVSNLLCESVREWHL